MSATPGPEQTADALLSGPWRAVPMAIRLAQAQGHLLVPPAASEFIAGLLAHFPDPPARVDLIAHIVAAAAEIDDFLIPSANLWTDLESVRRRLDVTQSELDWFADLQGRARRDPLTHYRWRHLPSGRLVGEPKPRLKEIQRRLLRHLLAPIPLHDAAHGGVPGRSVRTAVAPHCGATVVIRADLRTFFDTINAGRVYGLLRRFGLDAPVARVVGGLVTTTAPGAARAALPQGAPTSPALANLVAFGLDRRLSGLASRFEARYSRYVDDLTFSGGPGLRASRAKFVAAVTAIVAYEGFALNDAKTVVLGAAGRQQVLGAVLNDHPTLPRRERDALRALLHNCAVHGWRSQAHGHPSFRAHVAGRVAAVGGLDPALGARLSGMLAEIDWS